MISIIKVVLSYYVICIASQCAVDIVIAFYSTFSVRIALSFLLHQLICVVPAACILILLHNLVVPLKSAVWRLSGFQPHGLLTMLAVA